MFSGIFKWFGNTKSKEQANLQTTPQEKSTIIAPANSIDKSAISKEWGKELEPLRKVRLWGWDSDNNPSFLVLYGLHGFIEDSDSTLTDDVEYTRYAIFSGAEGHLPSFEAVKIVWEADYYARKDQEEYPKMFYKKALINYWQKKDLDYVVKSFRNLPKEQRFSLPYFVNITYEELVAKIQEQNIDFSGFKFAKNPNEILDLPEKLSEYYNHCCHIMSSDSIYMRKKTLKALLNSNPPEQLYKKLFSLGSTELVSGLFLELAKKQNKILLSSAEKVVADDIHWAGENYVKGVKRCAKIYINALSNDKKSIRTNEIRKLLPEMDLVQTKMNNKDIPEGRILEGKQYRKYSMQGLYDIYSYRYDPEKRETVKELRQEQFKKSFFCDGLRYDLIEFKNIMQEAEVYGLADVIGKVAYYIDAPRLTFFLKGTGKGKAVKYYQKYLTRILDGYAKTQPDKFIQAMKELLTSYTERDYVCKFPGNFQFNYFIGRYLYSRLETEVPSSWYARYKYMEEDQLLKAEGRYEVMPEIWDNYLEDVLAIAVNAKIATIQKACYFILKDSAKVNELIGKMSNAQLITLTQVEYAPLADWFTGVFNDKLAQQTTFDFDIMFELMNNPSEKLHEVAIQYFSKTNGYFTPDNTASLLLLHNIERWSSLFEQNLYSLSNSEYVLFVKAIVAKSDKFLQAETKLPKNITDLISLSTSDMEEVADAQKAELASFVNDAIYEKTNMPDWVVSFLEEVIFAMSYSELSAILNTANLTTSDKALPARSKQIVSMLECIKVGTIPTDAQIIGILETGTSKMIKTLIEMMDLHSESLHYRNATLLIMAECDVTMLNNKAFEIFDVVTPEQQRKLHKVYIDSPVPKVYCFGLSKLDEIYGELIPSDFIMQMMEHTSSDVKAYISDKTNSVLDNLENSDIDLFLYYAKALLLLPNKVSKSKNKVYNVIPLFVDKYPAKLSEIENLLLDVGGSNMLIDSERALTTLARIRKEAV